MSARKEYDAIGQELMASGDYSPKQIARILLAREQEKQARGVQSRLSDEDREDAHLISQAIRTEELDLNKVVPKANDDDATIQHQPCRSDRFSSLADASSISAAIA